MTRRKRKKLIKKRWRAIEKFAMMFASMTPNSYTKSTKEFWPQPLTAQENN